VKISEGRKGGCKCFRCYLKDLAICNIFEQHNESASNEMMKFCETRLVCMLHL